MLKMQTSPALTLTSLTGCGLSSPSCSFLDRHLVLDLGSPLFPLVTHFLISNPAVSRELNFPRCSVPRPWSSNSHLPPDGVRPRVGVCSLRIRATCDTSGLGMFSLLSLESSSYFLLVHSRRPANDQHAPGAPCAPTSYIVGHHTGSLRSLFSWTCVASGSVAAYTPLLIKASQVAYAQLSMVCVGRGCGLYAPSQALADQFTVH